MGLLGIEPFKLSPTWRIQDIKRIDCFLITEYFIYEAISFRMYYKFPVESKPPSPMKLTPKWLEEQECLKRIKESWIPFDRVLSESTALQLEQNLKRAKGVSIEWANYKMIKDELILKEVEEKASLCIILTVLDS